MQRNHTLVAALALTAAAACTTEAGTEGADCPNDNNCIKPLRCIMNVCTQVADDFDAGVADNDAGEPPEDAGNPPQDAGNPPTPDAGPPDTGVAPYTDEFASGAFNTTADGTGLGYTLTGQAAMIREESGYTSVLAEIQGLNPNATYASHVHAKACNDEGGGGHYKIDTAIMDAQETNEFWLSFETDANGDGVAWVRMNHYARTDAMAVVIHETGMPTRVACADLTPNADVTQSGTFIELTAGQGSGITGTATLRRYSGGTVATVEFSGTLTADETYPSHVHAQACDDGEGGGHYKIDQSVMDTQEANEIWPAATANSAGAMANGTVSVTHIARHDARSIVVHDPASGDKLLCADLRF